MNLATGLRNFTMNENRGYAVHTIALGKREINILV